MLLLSLLYHKASELKTQSVGPSSLIPEDAKSHGLSLKKLYSEKLTRLAKVTQGEKRGHILFHSARKSVSVGLFRESYVAQS